ncbi:MAG TPA: T9SS type A sorting domain-containing protein, partial [Chitinophagaceae bacterium]|nr:T9SS type A sorting domain-containing protein [Chitinophagaceae bacterium]
IQRIDAKGFVKWTLNGVGLCTETADQSTPAITTDMRGGAIIAWSDWRSSIERDLYAQRIDSNGNIKWTINGTNISDLSNREHSEKIVSDGHGGVIIAFEKQVSGVWDVWAQRLDSSGNKMWGQGGVAVSTFSSTKRNHRIQKDRSGGAFVSWQDNRNGAQYDVYAQRLSPTGTLLWGAAAKQVCGATGDQVNAKIESDSARNGCYIAWQDNRGGVSNSDDIYMQNLDSNGNALWTANGIVVCNAAGNQSALDFMSIDNSHDVIITWKDNRMGNEDIYVQRISSSGIPVWAANGVVVCNKPGADVNPNICSDNAGGAIIAWQDSTASGWDVLSQHVRSGGSMAWTPNGEMVGTAFDEQSSIKNVRDGKGGSIYAWQDKRNGLDFDIYAHHLFASGSPNAVHDVTKDTHDFIMYPNPASHTLTLESTIFQHQDNRVVLMNMVGSVVYNATIKSSNSTQLHLDISTFPKGLYMLMVNEQSRKLVVE